MPKGRQQKGILQKNYQDNIQNSQKVIKVLSKIITYLTEEGTLVDALSKSIESRRQEIIIQKPMMQESLKTPVHQGTIFYRLGNLSKHKIDRRMSQFFLLMLDDDNFIKVLTGSGTKGELIKIEQNDELSQSIQIALDNKAERAQISQLNDIITDQLQKVENPIKEHAGQKRPAEKDSEEAPPSTKPKLTRDTRIQGKTLEFKSLQYSASSSDSSSGRN